MSDVWEMFRTILKERKHREIDPTLEVLRECVAELDDPAVGDAYARERLREMLDFFETVTTVFDQVEQLPTESLKRMARLGDNFAKVLSRFTQSER